jgi:hypothetical protein
MSGIAAEKVRAAHRHPRSSPTPSPRPVTARRPKTRYAVGYGANPMILLHTLLPNRIFDAFIQRATGAPS